MSAYGGKSETVPRMSRGLAGVCAGEVRAKLSNRIESCRIVLDMRVRNARGCVRTRVQARARAIRNWIEVTIQARTGGSK